MKNAEYALSKLTEFCSQIDSSTSTSQFTVSDKVHFYLDSFFAFLYSSFDVVAQVVNQKSHLLIDENQVSIKSIKTKLIQTQLGTPIQVVLKRICTSRFFKVLEKYRNCSTHLRQICIQSQRIETTLTPGYNATVPMPRISHKLCDDPLTINPRFSKNREMIKHCVDSYNKTTKEIGQILNKL